MATLSKLSSRFNLAATWFRLFPCLANSAKNSLSIGSLIRLDSIELRANFEKVIPVSFSFFSIADHSSGVSLSLLNIVLVIFLFFVKILIHKYLRVLIKCMIYV